MAEPAKAPYEGYMVYRVYHKKQARFMAVLVSPGHRTTIAYAKYNLETHLRRKLKPGCQAHHKDEYQMNDDVSNLEEKLGTQHMEDHRRGARRKFVLLDCLVCGVEFLVEYRQTHLGKRSEQISTACSKRCARRKHPSGTAQVVKRLIWLSRSEEADFRACLSGSGPAS